MLKIATPISHLFDEKEEYATGIQELSDCLESREAALHKTYIKQEKLFHSHFQIVHKLKDKDWEVLKAVKEKKKDLKLISFHCASNFSDPIIKEGMFQPGGKELSREELLKNARENIIQMKKIFGETIFICAENNNYFPTPAYKWITDADFIFELVTQNNIHMLFDIAHAHITSENTGVEFKDYINKLPLDRVKQMHLCTYSNEFDDHIARDVHEPVQDFIWEEVKEILPRLPLVEYATIEFYKDFEILKSQLRKLRQFISELS